MPQFGKASKEKLATAHPNLQKVMNDAIQYFDFTVLYGERSKEEQNELFKIGREKKNGQWVVVGKTVTNIDGLSKLSKHNYSPSLAVDIAPYPIDWGDIGRFKELAKVIKESAVRVGVEIQWGGDWKSFKDYPHFELA